MSDDQGQAAQAEMPRYRCHKEVWALKIRDVELSADPTKAAVIVPVAVGYRSFPAPDGWLDRFKGRESGDMGYYVVYADGYASWSPTQAFEEGYTLIE